MLALSNEMFAVWHSFRREEIDATALLEKLAPVEEGWKADATLLQAGPKGKGRALGASLLKLWPALWNFAIYDDVEPTNNAQEQAIRKAVKIRKNTFGSTSAAGAQRTAGLLTIRGTARRQGIAVFQWLTEALDRHNRGLAGLLLLPKLSATDTA